MNASLERSYTNCKTTAADSPAVNAGEIKLKYSYLHGGVTTLEPCYDLGRNAWDFAISRRLYDNVFKATYQIWSKNLALEWLRNRVFNGTFKISASVNLAEKSKDPKFIAETTWELET
ncbi:Outer envelope pore protein 24A [Hibiscus syriacus]|uniref:Outer envelope pore protein 24A n=1 Tax=Hibiscus syriacus TaxID=106335 RepID=A0A6A2YS61_HIBSY|nr:Outer envelope pore protein 24A [Hibiscus syriacus]